MKNLTSRLVSFLAAVVISCSAEAQSMRDVNKILGGELKGRMEFSSEVNVPRKSGLELVKLGKTTAVRMRLEYDKPGGALDWKRHGTPGFAQRLQVREKKNRIMKPGREYWYRIFLMLPKDNPRIVDNMGLSLFDIKHHVNHGSYPLAEIRLTSEGLRLDEALRSDWSCGSYKNVEGGQTATCTYLKSMSVLGSQARFSGRWVSVVMNFRSHPTDGHFRIWVDKKPVLYFRGDTQKGSRGTEFKFGPYRVHMTKDPGDMEVLYSGIARGDSCEVIGIKDCAQLLASQKSPGYRNIGRQHYHDTR